MDWLIIHWTMLVAVGVVGVLGWVADWFLKAFAMLSHETEGEPGIAGLIELITPRSRS
jgi:hypothetical protein